MTSAHASAPVPTTPWTPRRRWAVSAALLPLFALYGCVWCRADWFAPHWWIGALFMGEGFATVVAIGLRGGLDRPPRGAWALVAPTLLITSGLRIFALVGTRDGNPGGYDAFEWLWESHVWGMYLFVVPVVLFWLFGLVMDYLNVFQFAGPVPRREVYHFFRGVLWTKLVADAAAILFLIATVGGIQAALYASRVSDDDGHRRPKSTPLETPLSPLLFALSLAVYLGPAFTTRLDDTLRATHRRLIRDRMLKDVPATVVLGYGRLGQRTVTELLRQEWVGRHRFKRMILPGVSEYVLEEAAWSPRGRPPREASTMYIRYATFLVVVEKDGRDIRGASEPASTPATGVAAVWVDGWHVKPRDSRSKTPRTETHTSRAFFVPTVVGDASSADVQARAGVSTARFVVSTLDSMELVSQLVHMEERVRG